MFRPGYHTRRERFSTANGYQDTKNNVNFSLRFWCARHVAHPGGGSPLWAVMTGTFSLSKGAHREVGSEGSLWAKLGPDEQEPDTRPAQWGNPAMDGEAR